MGTVTTTETPLLTFEEFERMEEEACKQELLEGELIEMPPPEYRHNTTSEEIFLALRAALAEAHSRGEAQDLGRVHFEMGYRPTKRSWFIPDVSVTHAAQTVGKYLEGAPAIAIEVVSPEQRAEALDRKTHLYFERGAREVWHLYMNTRHMMVYTGSPLQVRVETETVTTPLLPGFSLSLRQILGD